MTIKRRLAVLENGRGGLSRFIVAIGGSGFDYGKELRQRGVVQTERDLVVLVSKPDEGTEPTITVDGVFLR